MIALADVLPRLLASDPTAPRLTAYDDRRPGFPERIELSAKVLANWVAKASGALEEEFEIGPGSRVHLALPAHWRGVYWAYAVWSVGGCLVTTASGGATPDPVDLTISDDPTTLLKADGDTVLVTLPALARSALVDLPAGAFDEVTNLASFGDRFVPNTKPASADLAWIRTGQPLAYGEGIDEAGTAMGARLAVHTDDLETLLTTTLGAWAVAGSVVLSSGTPLSAAALESERVDVVVT